MDEPINLDDLEPMARARLSSQAYDYVAVGADDEQSVRDARSAFGGIQLRPRVLVDVAARDLRTVAFGREPARDERSLALALVGAPRLGDLGRDLGGTDVA